MKNDNFLASSPLRYKAIKVLLNLARAYLCPCRRVTSAKCKYGRSASCHAAQPLERSILQFTLSRRLCSVTHLQASPHRSLFTAWRSRSPARRP